MKKSATVLTVCAAIGLTFSVPVEAKQPRAERKAAIQAAQSWLALVDAKDYGESWSQAASYFKSNVSKKRWVAMVKGVRGPLGSLKTRKVLRATVASNLPGAPDGRYVVIQFKTSFANKKNALETVTPMLETDGAWRVSGYYIK